MHWKDAKKIYKLILINFQYNLFHISDGTKCKLIEFLFFFPSRLFIYAFFLYIYIFWNFQRRKRNEKPTERAVMKWQRCSNKFVYLDHVTCGFFQRIFKPCTIIVLKEAKMEQKQKMQNTRPKFVSHEENIIKKNLKPFKIIKSIELRRNYKLQKKSILYAKCLHRELLME